MDLISVYPAALKPILEKIKDLGIRIKIRNSSRLWSEHFYTVEAIREIDHREFKLTVLVLFDLVEQNSTVIDLKSVFQIDLERPYEEGGVTYRKIQVLKENAGNTDGRSISPVW
jgi:hypothetical protein